MVDHTPTANALRTRAKDLLTRAAGPMFRSDTFERAIRTALSDYVASDEFKSAVGAAVLTALRTAGPGGDPLSVAIETARNVLRDPHVSRIESLSQAARVDKGTQILLAEKYKELHRTGAPLPSFTDVGFRTYSQFDEDGILLFLFSIIGTTSRKAIEACAGVGFECNCANLIIHHGWDALLLDGSESNCQVSREFFANRSDTQITPPKVVHSWLEPDTIDGIIRDNGFAGDVDLMTIDLDGVDYWFWKAIECTQPRVVVVEYQGWWQADEPYTVKNIANYWYPKIADQKPGYVGCSLGAYVELGRQKGYRLVGFNRNHLNAFFLRNDIAPDVFPEVPAADGLTHRRCAELRAWLLPHLQKQLAAGEWHRAG